MPFRADELRVLQRAAEVQVVGGAVGDRDAHAGTIDVVDRADRRAGRHEIARLDLEVRRREVDLGRAHRLVGEERDVPRARLAAVGELAGLVVVDELDREAGAAVDLARKIRGDPAGLAAGRRPLGKQEVAEVEPDAELAGRRQLGADGGGEFGGHVGAMLAQSLATRTYGRSACCGRSSRISNHAAFEPTKMCASGPLASGVSIDAHPDAQHLGHAVAETGDRRAAVRAELAVHARRRAERLERFLPRDDDEVLRRDDRVGGECGAAGLAAAGTVAVNGGLELTANLVLHGPAKTATRVHWISS